MKSVVLLLSALAALSSAGPLDVRSSTEWTTESDLNGSPNITVNVSLGMNRHFLPVNQFRQQKAVQSSPFLSEGESFLEWVTWKNSLPNNAVSIYNSNFGRTDYVCKYRCHAGYYTPTKGSYCYYANAKREHTGSPFEILVNKNNFEVLEWKDASGASVPKNSVRTCPAENIYVGKNKYGLGRVDTDKKLFYLPWKRSERTFRAYQVLTVSENIVSQQIDDVRYTNGSEMTKYPPEIIRESTIKNLQCQPVERTDTLSKTYQVAKTWDFGFSITGGVKTSFTVGIPLIAEGKIEVGLETTFDLHAESTVTESVTDTVSVQLTVPPNKTCSLNMMRYKNKLTIPFTARLRRFYGSGEIHTMFFTGTYKSFQVAKMEVVLDRCQLVENPQPCE